MYHCSAAASGHRPTTEQPSAVGALAVLSVAIRCSSIAQLRISLTRRQFHSASSAAVLSFVHTAGLRYVLSRSAISLLPSLVLIGLCPGPSLTVRCSPVRSVSAAGAMRSAERPAVQLSHVAASGGLSPRPSQLLPGGRWLISVPLPARLGPRHLVPATHSASQTQSWPVRPIRCQRSGSPARATTTACIPASLQ